jgi:myosin heavy subunit
MHGAEIGPWLVTAKFVSHPHTKSYSTANTTGGDARANLPPHVYETSSLAYRGLAVDGKHQSILVSGESGAGKTETVKIVMSHLAGGGSNVVIQRVLDSHPLLEAFGNAKTTRNDNSSRFGKFIQLQFDVEDATAAFSGRAVPNCVLAGSTCETYLLEKSRVVGHEAAERTYHIFYQLLCAPDETKREFWSGLVGKGPADFRYVGHSDTTHIEGKTDAERFALTHKALTVLDIKGEKLRTLLSAVCVVLQLGNLVVESNPTDEEKSVISSKDQLKALSELMGVETEFLETSLTHRTVVAGKESYLVPMTASDARDGCDAFAKEIYQQIFDWLVREINRVTCAEANYKDAADVEEYGFIGLLDIFGFESFEVNRFEQLCINYTNEKLQQKYTQDIFRSVQEEYSQEGIELGDISFEDNAEVLQLIEGKIGIISVLNEECVRPKGNDTSFVSKVKTVSKDISCLLSAKLHKPTEFGIQHYAGAVTYDSTNFVQKNTDALPKDLIDCASSCSNELIRVELKAAADAKAGTSGKRGAATLTVATKFKAQLVTLMHDIAKTKTRYIRCIKPNPEKVPLKMNMCSSAEQLRCAGVVAAVTISRVAFPNRLMHETALERFHCLSHTDLQLVADEKKEESENDATGYRDAVSRVLTGLLAQLEVTKADGNVVKAFECGRSRVYFRTGALEFLEAKRLVALGVFAIAIERIVRGFTARSIYWKLRDAVIDSQANARRTVGRKKFLRAVAGCLSIECWIRCVFAKRELVRLRREKACIELQSKWRSFVAVRMLVKSIAASRTIEKIVRGALQRPKYRQALKDAEEEARVNSKVAALQKRLQEAEMKWFQADKMRAEAEKRAQGLVLGNAMPDTHTILDSDEEKKVDGVPLAQQQALIDESKEMLEYFRAEVFKLKSANYLLRTDLAALKQDHQQLQMHNESIQASNEALKQNMSRMTQNNMKVNVQAIEQRNMINGLAQDLKMEQLRSQSELKRKDEAILGRDKMHGAETARLKRELENLRKVIAKEHVATQGETAAMERASFKQSTRTSVLGNRHVVAQRQSMSRSPSMENMSVGGSTHASSEEEWSNQASFSRPEPKHRNNSSHGGHHRYRNKGRPPPITTTTPNNASGSGWRRPSDTRRPPKSTPNSSLAAAVAGGSGKISSLQSSRGSSPAAAKKIDGGALSNSSSSLAMAAKQGKKQ